jgi:hemerythrin
MNLKWKENFSCNIADIDNQHKKMFEIGERLFGIASSIVNNSDRYDEITKIINELKEYTIYHFGYEEKLMKGLLYEGYDSHKAEHETFIDNILEIEKENLDVHQKESVINLIAFVSDWVTNHILNTDIQYRAFFNSKGIY